MDGVAPRALRSPRRKPIILEKLDQDAALATLADLARHHPLLARTSAAERLALDTQTAGQPLLLRWVAGQLGRGKCHTFTRARLPAHLPAGQMTR